MPENMKLQLEEVSEAALKERIQLRKVKAAVDMYDQLQQSGAHLAVPNGHLSGSLRLKALSCRTTF